MTTWSNPVKPSMKIEYLMTEILDFLMTEDDNFLITNQSNVWATSLKPSTTWNYTNK